MQSSSSSSPRPSTTRHSSSTRSVPSRPKGSSRSSESHRSVLSSQKTEIRINVYDLLPPGKLASLLWTIGGSLLHSGVVVRNKEYAFGGHDRRGVTGVYHTRPRLEPPGGTFRLEILQGFTVRNEAEIEAVMREASERFLGTSYNLLTNNCNHFTSYLCQRLTGRPAPRWLNRAASVGLSLPCLIPTDWITPPEYDTVDGELLDEEDDDDERTRILRKEQWRRCARVSEEEENRWADEMGRFGSSSSASSVQTGRRSYAREEGPRVVSLRDTSGREMPASERAPVPKGVS